MLNALWIGFILVAFLIASFKLLVLGDADIFAALVRALFDSSKTAFEIALGLTGVMALWLGVMKIGERAGMLDILTRGLAPLFRRLFPDVPPNHPALGAMTMNMGANMLGLDNAATPLGIKAMQELQTLNPSKDTASDAQILFLVINTASVTLLPVTIFTYRAQLGAADPTDVFIPLLITTYIGTLVGLFVTGFFQKLHLWNRVTLAYLGGATLLVGGMVVYFGSLDAAEMTRQSSILSNVLLFGIVATFLLMAVRRRVNAYEAFIEGAKDGFHTAVTIIPYLVAMLVAIAVFRASGALELLMGAARSAVLGLGFDARWIDGLPTALMKPFSGSGARAMMIDTMQTHGADSFAGRLASIVQGSTETTFYVLAVYFGAVGIKRVRHAVACGLIADVAGILAAIGMAYLFFGAIA
ncbi:MAG: nucleoside recognition domain-containing protein [Thiobacillus sp.]|uniref:nucleoside recognition domain-containing protein n=1 Tax=Thiobacillus sp. TaxID=924 RepID=UPI002736E253|nr:spore maturation protein [Thiobacillus sp.]MDP3419718.1 nucleoside recognition domain-containing protein [Thiobacillus sp.]MDP3584263.1 nucleoside recognition domain-containing protein [Thiobacillus sp.]